MTCPLQYSTNHIPVCELGLGNRFVACAPSHIHCNFLSTTVPLPPLEIKVQSELTKLVSHFMNIHAPLFSFYVIFALILIPLEIIQYK